MNNWEILCKNVAPLIRRNVDEDLYHSQFETYLETIFHWDETSIKHKPLVKWGTEKKEADIVLVGNGFGIVIEMKRPNIELGFEEEHQLTGYMRILKYKYGLLIGNKIKVFYDDDTVGAQPIEVASFSFDDNNSDGIALSDILDNSKCSNEKLMEYVNIRIEQQKKIEQKEKLKNELLADDKAKIKEILKNKLMSDGYNEEVICSILNDIFNKKDNTTIIQQIPLSNNILDEVKILDEVMNYYNSIRDHNFECFEKHIKYRQIAIIETEKNLHYEFLVRENSFMGVEIHMEDDKFIILNDVISSFKGEIRGYTIRLENYYGRDRIKIRVPLSAGKEECSLVMKELINLTYEKIRDECKKKGLS